MSLRDYDKWTPRERRERAEGEGIRRLTYPEHVDLSPLPHSVVPKLKPTAARAQDSDPASAQMSQENSGSQSDDTSGSAQEESVDSGVTDTCVSVECAGDPACGVCETCCSYAGWFVPWDGGQ